LSTPSSETAPKSRLLPTIILALAATLAGVYFGLGPDRSAEETDTATVAERSEDLGATIDTGPSSNSGDDPNSLKTIQAQLKNTTVLPTDFRSVPTFELQGVDGKTLDQQVLDGQWSMMFFGYTYCPDICPITLQVMKEVITELDGQKLDPLQVVFTTVDPVRDTADRLKEYIGFFSEEFIGITGELTSIHEFTRDHEVNTIVDDYKTLMDALS